MSTTYIIQSCEDTLQLRGLLGNYRDWTPPDLVLGAPIRLQYTSEGYTCAVRHRVGIILLNCRNSETCNKKEKTPLHDHLEYLLVQNPLSEDHKDRNWALEELRMHDLH